MSSTAGPGHYRILAALVLGAALGVAANTFAADDPAWGPRLKWVVHNVTQPVGQMFINLLMMAIIPLVFASLALGVTKLGGGAGVGCDPVRAGGKSNGFAAAPGVATGGAGLAPITSVVRASRATAAAGKWPDGKTTRGPAQPTVEAKQPTRRNRRIPTSAANARLREVHRAARVAGIKPTGRVVPFGRIVRRVPP